MISSSVFITIGPCQAIGSLSGVPEIKMKRALVSRAVALSPLLVVQSLNSNLNVQVRRARASLAESVAETAKTWDASLIVVGTHGRKGVRRALMGSGAEHIIRLAPCPVLVIRSNPET